MAELSSGASLTPCIFRTSLWRVYAVALTRLFSSVAGTIHLRQLLTLYQMARDCYHYKLEFSSKLLEKTVRRIWWLKVSKTNFTHHVTCSCLCKLHMGYCSCFNSESCCSAATRTYWSDLNGFLRRNPSSYLCCNSFSVTLVNVPQVSRLWGILVQRVSVGSELAKVAGKWNVEKSEIIWGSICLSSCFPLTCYRNFTEFKRLQSPSLCCLSAIFSQAPLLNSFPSVKWRWWYLPYRLDNGCCEPLN